MHQMATCGQTHSVAFVWLEWDLQVEFDPELVEPAECFTGLGKLSAS